MEELVSFYLELYENSTVVLVILQYVNILQYIGNFRINGKHTISSYVNCYSYIIIKSFELDTVTDYQLYM